MTALILSGSLLEFFSSPWIICAIILLILGIALAMLAKTLTVKVTKQEFDKQNRFYKNLLVVALTIILVGTLLLIVGVSLLAGLF